MVATIVARNIVVVVIVVVVAVVVPTIVAPVTVRVQVTWVACAPNGARLRHHSWR